MATLVAYASPADFDGVSPGDHTWVASDESTEACWPCLGGGPGYYCGANRWHKGKYQPPEGRIIGSVEGDLARAKCLGGPKRTTTLGVWPTSAGIVYGVNGVCHQIANRVLYGTGLTVAGVSGYWQSCSVYGTYGTMVGPSSPYAAEIYGSIVESASREWKQRIANCPPQTTAPTDTTSLIGAVSAIYTGVSESTPLSLGDRLELHLRELDAIVQHRLGQDGDPEATERVKDLFRKWLGQTPQAPASKPSALSAADAVAMAKQLNDELSRFFATVADSLGAATYQKLFDATPGARVVLVNPQSLVLPAAE